MGAVRDKDGSLQRNAEGGDRLVWSCNCSGLSKMQPLVQAAVLAACHPHLPCSWPATSWLVCLPSGVQVLEEKERQLVE